MVRVWVFDPIVTHGPYLSTLRSCNRVLYKFICLLYFFTLSRSRSRSQEKKSMCVSCLQVVCLRSKAVLLVLSVVCRLNIYWSKTYYIEMFLYMYMYWKLIHVLFSCYRRAIYFCTAYVSCNQYIYIGAYRIRCCIFRCTVHKWLTLLGYILCSFNIIFIWVITCNGVLYSVLTFMYTVQSSTSIL